jgi:parallel beta-helix repeat protein
LIFFAVLKSNLKKIVLILTLLLVASFFPKIIKEFKFDNKVSAAGNSWYVDSQAGGLGNGTSWQNAWKSLSAVNWSQVNPGDTVYISGGTSSKTYAGGIGISKSGTSSAYVTIDVGANSPSPSGHNGEVIIDGGDYCIRSSGSYIKIKNLTCQHATASGLRIGGTGAVLEGNTVRENQGQGIHLSSCNSCVARGNRITSFPNDGSNENRPYQTDGIVSYGSADTLIEYNWIKLTNQYEPAHIDGIQANTAPGLSHKNITIRYNYVENTKAATSNSQGIYVTQMQGDVKIIGNVVHLPVGGQAVTSYLENSLPVNVYVVGNVIKNGGYWALHVGDNDPVIKNNIIWQTCGSSNYISNGSLIKMESGWAGNASNINNNLYYRPCSSGTDFYAPNGSNWGAWQSKGFDSQGIFGQNPGLDACYRPIASSPAIGKAAALGGEYAGAFSMNICGSNGPSNFLPVTMVGRGSGGWDIGPYEYTGGVPLPTQTGKIGDVDGNGKVDIVDIGIVIDNYARSPLLNSKADVNRDGKVDIVDIGLIIDNYGK